MSRTYRKNDPYTSLKKDRKFREKRKVKERELKDFNLEDDACDDE